MDQPKRRHLHVADLTCIHCAEKDAELERKTEIVRALQFELNKAMENEAAANEVAKAAGRAAAAAKAQRTRQAHEEAEGKDIRVLLDFWQESHPKAQCPPGGKRWEVCKKALVLMKDDDAGPVNACLEALEGIRLFPFMDMKTFQRHPENTGGNMKLKDDVEHSLGDEVRISRARSLSRWARGDLADRCWEQYQWCQFAADYWSDLVLEGLGERRRRSIVEMVEQMPKDER